MIVTSIPLVSIIMPAYNVERFISKSIDSVIAQTYGHWELIIINDGSIDGTQKIAEEYAVRDKRIIVINQKNSRLGGARNSGLKVAEGQWIAFLDSDDLWISTKLEKQMSAAQNDNNIDVIYSDGWVFFDNDPDKLFPYPTIVGDVMNAKQMYHKEYVDNYIPVLSVVFKKEIFDLIGYQETRYIFSGCEDFDYWLRMAVHGAVFFGLKEKLFLYRRHENNMSSDSINMNLSQLNVWIKNYYPPFITVKQFEDYLKPFLNRLIVDLIRARRSKEIYNIIDEFNNVSTSNFYGLIKIIVKLFGKYSSFPVRIVNKVDSIVH